jgi:hypothetical protein
MKLSITIISVFVLLSACVPISKNPKYLFSDGFYEVRTGKQKQKAYVHVTEDEIRQYNIIKATVVDTTHYVIISVRDSLGGKPVNYTFIKYSFDIDLISIPLKFKPATANFPAQLNATINGGLFIGRRADIYHLRKSIDPLGVQTSSMQHFGFSFGAFTGLGSTVMNPSVTANAIEIEYDALVIPAGLTALVGYNNLTFGVAAGIDHMLSPDRRFWIYKGKPWVGLTLGLNLN